MKKIIYTLIVASSIIATSCNPLEETYKELDDSLDQQNIIVGTENYTLVDDDYKKTLKLDFSSFSTDDQAKELIPVVLAENYPVYGEKSNIKTTYQVYDTKYTEDSLVVYTISEEDYSAYPATSKYKSFNSVDLIYPFLDIKYPDIKNKTLVSLTYQFYSKGVTKEVNNGFLKVDNNWVFAQGFTDEEYTGPLQENNTNFGYSGAAIIKIPIYLKEKYKYEVFEENTIKSFMYKLYEADVYDTNGNGNVKEKTTNSHVINFLYSNGEWTKYDNVLTKTLQFGFKKGEWVPDNTIKLELADGNYATIGNHFLTTDGFEKAADNLAHFKSFERRPTDTEYWSDDMLTEVFGYFLDSINPDAEEGQKYIITFDTYIGSNATEDIDLIKDATGTWIRNVE